MSHSHSPLHSSSNCRERVGVLLLLLLLLSAAVLTQ